MWKSSTPSPSKRKERASSISQLSLASNSFFQRTVSLQFLNRSGTKEEKEERARIRLRYKDIAKGVIWPHCRYPPDINLQDKEAPIAEGSVDISKKYFPPEIEDHRSPYLPCAINQVLRSDSEDSEDDIDRMTRL